MPITIEEFMKLPERRFPPLVEYVQKRFGSKQGFVSFLFEETGVKLQAKPYGSLMNEIFEKVGKQKLLSLLGIKDEREAELRAYLFDALYRGLTEAAWAHHLSPLYERVTRKKVKIVRKIDKKRPAHALAFTTDEKAFTKAWVSLYEEGILPAAFQGVESAEKKDERTFRIRFSGGIDAQERILAGIVKMNIGIISYKPAALELEDAYLKLIKSTL